MALPPRESSVRRPCDVSPWEGDLEAYREDLYAGMAFGMRDVRAFAREWLEVKIPLQRPGDPKVADSHG